MLSGGKPYGEIEEICGGGDQFGERVEADAAGTSGDSGAARAEQPLARMPSGSERGKPRAKLPETLKPPFTSTEVAWALMWPSKRPDRLVRTASHSAIRS